MADNIQIQQDIERTRDLPRSVTRGAVDRANAPKTAAEIALEKSAKKYGDAIVGAQQERKTRAASMTKFKRQMALLSARREQAMTGWQDYKWIDLMGDDTANRGIVLDATNSWSYAPRFGYA